MLSYDSIATVPAHLCKRGRERRVDRQRAFADQLVVGEHVAGGDTGVGAAENMLQHARSDIHA